MEDLQKVLIVDDETRNQRIIMEILEGQAELRVAGTGEEGLTAVSEFRPDLVLLDIMMPGIDGYEVCRRIRANAELALTKVILVSGKAMIDERLKGYEAGADGYMTKPFISEELLAKSKVFLRLARAERELFELNRSLDEKVRERTERLLMAEAKLVTSAKMSALGEMAAGIAHEINTPLATIGMGAEQILDLIAETPPDVVAVSGMTKRISETVDRIGAIIRGLRTFSRDGSHDRFDPCSLGRIIEDTLALCRERILKSGVELRVDSVPEDLMIACRAVEISQVLLNLIANACDAIAELPERWIEVSVKTTEDQVVLAVTDSGRGIPEAARDKIFQPFFTTKEVGKGTGLGLSVSKGIVETHGGKITLDPESPNTRFVIEIPGKVVA
jgi:C4-dicarboxylate-specific signal transduction histidine kinase